MIKTCKICSQSFKTKDSRQQTCGKACADVARANFSRDLTTTGLAAKAPKPILDINDLPPVDTLPAEYVKRCYDHWRVLIGELEDKKRIA